MAVNSGQSQTSDSAQTKTKTRSKDVPWYLDSIDHNVNPEIRNLLETYSKVPRADVIPHVRDIREQAWAIRPYPCIGLGTFLRPALPNIPAYDTILKRLQQGESLVDIGCFIGHDLRRLVADGAPSEHVYAVDVANFWDVGYDMFRDRDRFSAHFIEADILSPNSEFQALHGTVDIVSIVSILHLWDLDTQMTAVRQLVKLLRPNAMVVGFQIGSASASVGPKGHFRHDAVSFANMWDQVGQETGTRWSCDAELKGFEEMGFDSSESAFLGADARILQFVLNRTE